MAHPLSNVIGIDDGPFSRGSGGPVLIAGPIFSGKRLDGLLTTQIEQDGLDSTDQLIGMLGDSKFLDHVQLIMTSGVTVGGFNVIDLERLSNRTGVPVIAIVRKQPDLDAVRKALQNLSDADIRWGLIEKLGPAEPLEGLFVHRVGIAPDTAAQAIARSRVHGNLPEPLRVAHILAGGMATGQSKGAA